MEALIEKLKNPFDGLKANDAEEFQRKCTEIAKVLLTEYGIECGNKLYHLAEVEFYYYEKGRWDKDWNAKTYPRKGKNAGDFFFHYGGVDICFDSFYDKDKSKFGGILIRSLKDSNGKFITGPSVCSLEIMNTCLEQKVLPNIKLTSNEGCEVCKEPITRYGIEYKDHQEDKHLCFYDEQIKDHLKNEFDDASWDFGVNKDGQVKGLKKLIRYYHRFDQ